RPATRTRSETSASTPTFAYDWSCRGTRRTRASSRTSTVNVTGMPGNTTVSSSGTIRSLFIVTPAYDDYFSLSIIFEVKYNRADEESRRRRLQGVAAPDEVLFLAAGASAGLRRVTGTVAGAVSRAASHRAWRTGADESTGGADAMRPVERDR